MSRKMFPGMKQQGGEERRAFRRVNDSIFISCRLPGRPLEECKAVTKNISCGGLMFELEQKVKTGAQLELGIYQPVNRFKTIIFVINTLARVVWMERIKPDFFEIGENKYRMGVEFAKINDSDREMIRQYVEADRR